MALLWMLPVVTVFLCFISCRLRVCLCGHILRQQEKLTLHYDMCTGWEDGWVLRRCACIMNSVLPSEPHDARVPSNVDTRLRAEDPLCLSKAP
jgi:hypothetical protein